jgi:preprotein translocase subunit SecF
LTAGGIAAYLMLIGYSVDTSILLSTKLLKEKKDDSMKALFGAMKTGLTMSAAGIASTGLSFLLTNNVILKQIMLILIVGLVVDVITTWIGNVTLLRMYLEKQHVKD